MADSVRMIDLAAQDRALENFRRIDPQQRLLSDRLAAEAAVHRIEDARRDVSESERAAEARVRPPHHDGERGGGDPDEREPPAGQRSKAFPEQTEGQLLDIVV